MLTRSAILPHGFYGFCFFFPHRLYLFYIQTLFVLFENFKRNAYKKKGDSKKKKN